MTRGRKAVCDWESALRDALSRGITRAQLAAEKGVSLSAVSRVCSFYGIKLPRQPYTAPLSTANQARAERICAAYRAGKTLAEIGVEYSITGERVRQILMRAGVTRRASSDASYWTEDRRVQAARRLSEHPKTQQTNPLLPKAVDLVREGYSFGEAASAIGCGLTRSAVAGACHRAGVKAEMTEAKRARVYGARSKRLALER